MIAVQSVPNLRTSHILLTPPTYEDAPAVQRHLSSWDVVKYLTRRTIPVWEQPHGLPEGGAAAYLRDNAFAGAGENNWFWALRLRGGPSEMIGMIQVFDKSADFGQPQGTVAGRRFWLAEEHQGKGLMTEASKAVTDYAFKNLGFKGMNIANAKINGGSSAIKQKSGFRLVGHEMHEYISGPHMAEIWEITAQEWAHHRKPQPASAPAVAQPRARQARQFAMA